MNRKKGEGEGGRKSEKKQITIIINKCIILPCESPIKVSNTLHYGCCRDNNNNNIG